MRKLLLFAFAVFFAKLSSAQITKGNWLLGGNIAYDRTKPKEFSNGIKVIYGQFDGTVNAGYFVVNKFGPGIRLNTQIGRSKYLQENGDKQILVQRNVGFGPFLRYYILAPEKKINIFGDGNLLYNIHSNTSTDVRSKSLLSSLGAGAVFFLNQSVGLEGLLSYSHYSDVDTDSDYRSNSLQFKIGLQVHFKKIK